MDTRSTAPPDPEASSPRETLAPVPPPPAPGAPEVVHHPRRFLRERLPIGADHAIAALLLLIPGGWLAGYLLPPVNHDVAAVLDVAHRWLGGERLYQDIIDVNLPLVFVLYAIPDLLARATAFVGWRPETWLTLCFYGAIAAAFLSCRALTRRVPSLAHPLTEALVPPTLLFLFAVLPNENFAQREHLMFIATAPYMLHAAARAEGRESAIGRIGTWAIALAAGIGLAQKPHFMLIPLAVEAYLLLHRGWRRTFTDLVPWIIGGCALAHLALIFLGTPAYVSFVLPIIWDSYANLGDVRWHQVLLGPVLGPTLLALLAFGLLAIFLARTVAARVIVAYGVGAALAAAAQAKGWPYHVLPALSAAILLASVTLSQMVDRYLPLDREAHRMPVTAIGATFLILLYFQAALFTPPFQKQRQFDDSITGVLMHVVAQNAPNKRILVLSPGIYPHYPLVNYGGLRMTMRFQTMWVLQGIYADCEEFPTLYTAPEDMSDVERFVFDSVSEDFERQRPDLVIVDRIAGVPRCQGRVFDYLEYFQRNARFAKAFERYVRFMEVDRYTIYKRR
ncbi:MAG: hypothetical protein IPK81_07800 [Rhodospirillales bacterium]|nr:MAG: hypothetical protein IPK81_07800 [Rhodospirillales bacterium]